MFLTLNHQKLQVYDFSKQFVLECYKLVNIFPMDEKFGMTSQIRRAAVLVHLNIAEGSSRKSDKDRKRFFEIARGSIIEIDAELDIAKELEYFQPVEVETFGYWILPTFKTLTGLIKAVPREP